MNNLSCILNNAWPLLQETKKIHWKKDKDSSILTVTMNTCSRECKLRKRNKDNVSIHQHLYRWTGQAKRPTDGRWTRLLVVKLKAHNKGSLCAFSCCRWELSSNSSGERGEWRMKPSTCSKAGDEVHWSSGHPRVAVWCVNMCKCSFMCMSFMNKDNVDRIK